MTTEGIKILDITVYLNIIYFSYYFYKNENAISDLRTLLDYLLFSGF